MSSSTGRTLQMANTLSPLDNLFKDCSFGFEERETIEFYASFIYGSLTIILYIVEICVIIRNPKLKQPFYYQFIFLAVMNILFWIQMFFMSRVVPNPAFCHYFYPVFKNPSQIFKPFVIIYSVSLSGQLFCVMMISINRLCVIQWPLTADKAWKKYDKWMLICLIGLSLLYSSHMWFWGTKVDFITTDHLALTFTEDWPYIKPNISFALLALICIIVIVISTAYSMLTLWRHPASTKVAEVNLFWTSVGFSVTTGILFVFMVYLYFIYWVSFDDHLMSISMDVRGFVYDINCLTPAWLLLFINRPIKRRLFNLKTNSSILNINSVT